MAGIYHRDSSFLGIRSFLQISGADHISSWGVLGMIQVTLAVMDTQGHSSFRSIQEEPVSLRRVP